MTENEYIQEMAKCCTYYHNGECCADATNISECDLMCEMFGVFTNLQKENYRKVKRGEWVQYGLCNPKCTLCHGYNTEKSNFCPNCGADMRKEGKGK